MANKFKLTYDTPVAAVSEKITLTAKVTDESDAPVPNATITWSASSYNDVVTLSNNSGTTDNSGENTIVAVSTAGAQATIKAALDDGTYQEVKVGFSSDKLSAPDVLQAIDGELTASQALDLVQAEIKRHSDAQATDLYVFYWGISKAKRADDLKDDTFPWLMNVKNTFSANDILAGGIYKLYYTITDPSGNTSYSPVLTLKVEEGAYINSIYDAPLFPDLKGDVINEAAISNDSGVRVKINCPQDNDRAKLVSGDVLSLNMRVHDEKDEQVIVETETVATYTITDDDIQKSSVEFYLPKSAVTDEKKTFDGVNGLFWYTVQGVEDNGKSYTTKLFIDTVEPN